MQDKPDFGRDSMQLAEMPITLLADRVPKGVNVLTFKSNSGQLVVSGSADYGLPTSVDGDVIVALLYLTRRASDFESPVVTFTRGEVLDILGWTKSGLNYKRVSEALERWVGVTLRFENTWFDAKAKKRTSASFHILESVVTHDGDDGSSPRTEITWNKVFFESLRSGYVKKLDIDAYFALKSSISRQIMRHLDKLFYLRPDWTFPLREFSFERIGLSRNYADKDLRKKLKVGFDELIANGFLKSATFASPKRGSWTVRVVGKGKERQEAKPASDSA